MSEDTSDGFADQPREIDRARTLLRELGLPTTKAHMVALALDGMRRLGRTEEEAEVVSLRARVAELEGQLNTPELHDFSKAVVLEAAHQRARWGSDHDAGKEPHDWFWLLGYLAGKALRSHQAGEPDKALHHCISSAAVLANWHAAVSGEHTHMRPGIETPAEADPV